MSSVGTEYKIKIAMEPIKDVHLADCIFECVFYVKAQPTVIVKKEEMIQVDEDNFIAMVDSSTLGMGKLMVKVKVELPDADFPDLYRTEIVNLSTGITIEA